jgi:hypothetical protein
MFPRLFVLGTLITAENTDRLKTTTERRYKKIGVKLVLLIKVRTLKRLKCMNSQGGVQEYACFL